MSDETSAQRIGRRILLGSALAGMYAIVDPAVAAGVPGEQAGGWETLMAGNRRWVAGRSRHPHADPAHRATLRKGQKPMAVVLSCVDSRVPPELIFDVGAGDLLVTRTAAHTLDALATESVRFGPAELGTGLIVVLGHQRCGAVTLAHGVLSGAERRSAAFAEIVAELRPAYRAIQGTEGDQIDAMVREHTRLSVAELRRDWRLRGATIVGAHYSLDTGRVTPVGR